jgi:hypothetical protein
VLRQTGKLLEIAIMVREQAPVESEILWRCRSSFQTTTDELACSPAHGCLADDQNSFRNGSDHQGARYVRFMLVRETESGHMLVILVANFELCKSTFADARFNRSKSVSHLRLS